MAAKWFNSMDTNSILLAIYGKKNNWKFVYESKTKSNKANLSLCLQMKQMSHYLILLGTSILTHLGNSTFMSHCVENIEPSRKSHQLELKQKIVISWSDPLIEWVLAGMGNITCHGGPYITYLHVLDFSITK